MIQKRYVDVHQKLVLQVDLCSYWCFGWTFYATIDALGELAMGVYLGFLFFIFFNFFYVLLTIGRLFR